MIKLNAFNILISVFALGVVLSAQSASAQKYKTTADTAKLNKEYGDVRVDLAKLNANLIEEQNKTNGYQNKTASTTQEAAYSAQASKASAATATSGKADDAKTAMKKARKANNQAKDAQHAKDDQADNIKKINSINEKIIKKQAILTDLEQQKAAIIQRATPAPVL